MGVLIGSFVGWMVGVFVGVGVSVFVGAGVAVGASVGVFVTTTNSMMGDGRATISVGATAESVVSATDVGASDWQATQTSRKNNVRNRFTERKV